MEKIRTVVQVAGQDFKLASNDSVEYMHKLAAYTNKKIDEVQASYPNISTGNCVILAALNMADELHKLQTDYEALDSRISALREMPRSAAALAAPVKRPFESKTPTTTK
ncbi:MAG: cell division protein ZapA [Clostridia bacterium]